MPASHNVHSPRTKDHFAQFALARSRARRYRPRLPGGNYAIVAAGSDWCSRKEGAVYVACSTQCFGRASLTDAFKSMGEMGFTKADVALTESGHHLKPSEVSADPAKAAQRLKSWPGVAPAAFHVEPAPELAQ